MSRNSDYSKVKGRKGERRFVAMYINMISSKAFMTLSGNSTKVFLQIAKGYNSVNNGVLTLSYEDALSKLGLTKPTFRKALLELEQKGFIKKSVQGGKNILNRFAVTCYPVNDCRNKDGIKMHNLPVSPVATNDWREYNKTLANKETEK